MKEEISSLVKLSREIGREDRQLAILAEGTVSIKLNAERFAVKASGCSLAALTEADVTVCDSAKVLAILEQKTLSDEAIDQALLEARVSEQAKKPSVEAVFHAWLLTLEGVNCVGHCHPLPANQALCSPRARGLAQRLLFPGVVVCCGSASVVVPFVHPGRKLAR